MPGEIIIETGSITISGAHPFVDVTGDLEPDGSFTATGTGTVAGFEDVSVLFNGIIDSDGLLGEYVMGANGELFGVPIAYSVTGDKLASETGDLTSISEILADLRVFEEVAIPQHEAQRIAAQEQLAAQSQEFADDVTKVIAAVSDYDDGQPVQIRLVVDIDQETETLLINSQAESLIDYRGPGDSVMSDINNPFDPASKDYSDLSDVDYTMYTLLSSLPAILSASPENIQKLYDASVFIVADGSGEIVVTNLSKGARDASNAQVTFIENNVYVVWQETMTETNTDVFFARSTDGGKTFASPVNISSNDGRSTLPQIAVFEDNVYVLWNDNSAGSANIFFARSTDAGTTFSDAIDISGSDVLSLNPKLAVAGDGTVIAVWAEMVTLGNLEILASRSVDGGATFADAVNVSNTSQGSFSPQLAASGQHVYAAWIDSTPGNDDIYLASSADSAATFTTAVNISNTEGESSSPQLAIADGLAHVVWQESLQGADEVYHARSSFDDTDFEITNISQNEETSQSPQVAALDSDVYVLWQDFVSGEGTLKLGKSQSGIITSPTDTGFSTTPGTSTQLAASDSGAFIVWIDSSNISLTKAIGDRIADPLILGRGSPSLPSVSLAQNTLYTAWQDSGTIYFARVTDRAGTLQPVPEELQQEIDQEVDQETEETVEDASVESTIIEIPRAVDSEGQVISRSSRGAPVEVEVGATKVEYPEDKPVLFTFEVRGQDGITLHFQTKESSFAIGDNILMKFSWVPDEPGTFTLRSFLMTSLEDPAILSDVVTSTIVVE